MSSKFAAVRRQSRDLNLNPSQDTRMLIAHDVLCGQEFAPPDAATKQLDTSGNPLVMMIAG